jgi:hypothetical protein
MKSVSFSLFGTNKRYTINALVNAELCLKYYNDWRCRIYYDDTVPLNILNNLKKFSNVDLIKEFGNGESRRMWRFFAYDDSDITIYRDIDSYITEREVSAVNEWLNSSKNLHIMRDHVHHTNKIQAGMFGLKKSSKLLSLKQLTINHITQNKIHYSMDEQFLCSVVYDIFKNDMIVHDDYNKFNDKTNNWKVGMEYTDVHGQFVGRSQFPPSINCEIFNKYEGECP